MMLSLAAVAVFAFQQADTTFTVEPGSRLMVSSVRGDITVRTWDRNQVRAVADLPPGTRLVVENRGPQVVVRSSGRAQASAEYELTVPAWMELNLTTVHGDIRITGTRGQVTAETVDGDVSASGGTGFVSLHSVNGAVTLTGANGRIELQSVNDDIRLTDASGEIAAEGVNGTITLQRVESSSVELSTVSGDVLYHGSIKPNGRYRFASHSGDVTVALPEAAGAVVQVNTFSGSFESDYPVTLTESRPGKRFSFTIGNGSARIDLESFSGEIRLKTAAALRQQGKDRDD